MKPGPRGYFSPRMANEGFPVFVWRTVEGKEVRCTHVLYQSEVPAGLEPRGDLAEYLRTERNGVVIDDATH